MGQGCQCCPPAATGGATKDEAAKGEAAAGGAAAGRAATGEVLNSKMEYYQQATYTVRKETMHGWWQA